MISIHLHKSFEKQFKQIPLKIKEKFLERKNLFLEDLTHPLLNNHPLTGDRKGEWGINVTGDWRAIYEYIDDNTVIFLEINTHGNLYKK